MKQDLNLLPADDGAGTEIIGADLFPLRPDSSLREEHVLISTLVEEVAAQKTYRQPDLTTLKAGRVLLEGDNASRGRILLAEAERLVNASIVSRSAGYSYPQSAVNGVFEPLLKTGPKLDRDGLFDLLLWWSARAGNQWTTLSDFVEALIPGLEKLAAHSPFTPGERHVLYRLRRRLVRSCPFGMPSAVVAKLTPLIGTGLSWRLSPAKHGPMR